MTSTSVPGKKNPWNIPDENEKPSSSLTDVMSEQLASDLLKKDLAGIPTHVEADTGFPQDVWEEIGPNNLDLEAFEDGECKDDLLIAQMLQMQYDKEYDETLKHEENHHNGANKITVSYSKYKVIPDFPIWDDESEDDDDFFTMDDRKRDWDSYETMEKEVGALPKCGYKKIGDKIVTKHNKELSQRANGKRIMEFPPGIETGDGGGIDMQLSNAVYNKIRNFSIKEGKRKTRIRDKEDKSTSDLAVDPQTRILLFKMVNRGVLESINGIISTGKEAVILHADGGSENEIVLNIPKETAIKVFKTTLNEFKTRDKYIKEDYRFKDRFGKQNPRKIVHIWAEKELHNLLKMKKYGVRVPEPIVLKNHILVMEFIGKDGQPAPKLKEAIMTKSELESAHLQVVSMMKKLYDECHLVHADLSEYNILWHEKMCWLIDVSQSVEPNHPHGLEFLMRDCTNVIDFFTRNGLEVGRPQDLFTEITGLAIDDTSEAEIIGQIRDYEKDAEILSGLCSSDKSYPFDYCWDRSKDCSGTKPQPIPGHPKSKSGKCGKSPKSPKTFPPSLGKSPSRKSPKSSMAGLTDQELHDLKQNLPQKCQVTEHEATKVKFEEEFPSLH